MFTKEFENVTVHFGPIIVIIVATFIVYSIAALFLRYRGKKVIKAFVSGNYDVVLIDGKKLLKTYQGYAKRYKHRNTLSWIEYLNFALAVAHFSMKNDEQFLKHINDFTQNYDIKEFWLALYYLQKEDFENAEEHYAKISITEEPSTNITYLDSIKLYKQGEYDSAKAKMTEIYGNLKHVVLKQIADEVLKSE